MIELNSDRVSTPKVSIDVFSQVYHLDSDSFDFSPGSTSASCCFADSRQHSPSPQHSCSESSDPQPEINKL